MANFSGTLAPASSWADIPKMTAECVLLAGDGGPLNEQALQLAARTNWLKDRVEGGQKNLAHFSSLSAAVATGKPVWLTGTVSADISAVAIDNIMGDGEIATTTGQLISATPPLLTGKIYENVGTELNLGFNNGTTDTQIFSGAQNAPQGLAYVKHQGVEYLFMLQRTVSNSYKTTERQRIVQFTYTETGTITPLAYSTELSIGHGQDLSAMSDGTNIWLYSTHKTETGYEDNEAGKGFSKIKWVGATTADANVTNYKLLGQSTAGHAFSRYMNATVCISNDGRYVILSAKDMNGDVGEDSGRTIFVYNKSEVEAASNPLTVMPIKVFRIPSDPRKTDSFIVQGMASDGRVIYVLCGYYSPATSKLVLALDFDGRVIRQFTFGGVRNRYGVSGIQTNALGTPVSMEPEGLAIRGSKLIVLSTDAWKSGASIVSYNGVNYACISGNTGVSPDNQRYWIKTTATPGGAWSETTAYTTGTTYTLRTKRLIFFSSTNSVGVEVNGGLFERECGANVYSAQSAADVAYLYGESFQAKAYSPQTGEYKNAFGYHSGHSFRMFDNRYGASNTAYSCFNVESLSGMKGLEVRGGTSINDSAGLNLYRSDDPNYPGVAQLYTGGGVSLQINSDGTKAVRAGTTNAQNLGTASTTWKDFYVQNAPTVVSDERKKTPLRDLTDAEYLAAVEIVESIGIYQMLDAVENKGAETARLHSGVGAQTVERIMLDNGLDPRRYAFFCFDQWEAEMAPEMQQVEVLEDGYLVQRLVPTGKMIERTKAGDGFAIRYEQLLSFLLKALFKKVIQ